MYYTVLLLSTMLSHENVKYYDCSMKQYYSTTQNYHHVKVQLPSQYVNLIKSGTVVDRPYQCKTRQGTTTYSVCVCVCVCVQRVWFTKPSCVVCTFPFIYLNSQDTSKQGAEWTIDNPLIAICCQHGDPSLKSPCYVCLTKSLTSLRQ